MTNDSKFIGLLVGAKVSKEFDHTDMIKKLEYVLGIMSGVVSADVTYLGITEEKEVSGE